jgi:hypothetical protein
MIDGLKSLFMSEVRKMRYKCLDEFLSTKLEENACLERHLANMHRIHANLVHVWGFHVTNKFAVDGVLHSLPPGYGDLVKEYVMEEKMFTFHGILAELRTLKVEPIAREVIDGEGIFDIRTINIFFLTNACCGLLSI